MTKSKFFRSILLIQLLIGCLYNANTQAHPHSWVDLKTAIVGDETHITGFDMTWTFDAMTSFYMLDGEALTDQNRDEVLNRVLKSVMENLVLEHYFTYFYDGETPIPYHSSLVGELTQHKTQLQLDFFIPLAEPKPITSTPLKLQVFEGSYFVDISWRAEGDIKLSPKLAERCSIQVIQANPSSEQLSYAMSLPKDAEANDTLGSVFTQSAILQCKNPKESK